jgi:hypothetical protein
VAPYAPSIKIVVAEATENVTITLENYPTTKISSEQSNKVIIKGGINLYCSGGNCGEACFEEKLINGIFKDMNEVNYTEGDLLYVNKEGDLSEIDSNLDPIYFCINSAQKGNFTNEHNVYVKKSKKLTLSEVETIDASTQNKLKINEKLTLIAYYSNEVDLSLEKEVSIKYNNEDSSVKFNLNLILSQEATTLKKEGSDSYQLNLYLDVSNTGAKNLTVSNGIKLNLLKVATITNISEEATDGIKFGNLLIFNEGTLDITLTGSSQVTLPQGYLTNSFIWGSKGDQITINNVDKIESEDHEGLKIGTVNIDCKNKNNAPTVIIKLKDITAAQTLDSFNVIYINVEVKLQNLNDYTIELTGVETISQESNGLKFNTVEIMKDGESIPTKVSVQLHQIESKLELTPTSLVYPLEITECYQQTILLKAVKEMEAEGDELKFGEKKSEEDQFKLTINKGSSDYKPTIIVELTLKSRGSWPNTARAYAPWRKTAATMCSISC